MISTVTSPPANLSGFAKVIGKASVSASGLGAQAAASTPSAMTIAPSKSPIDQARGMNARGWMSAGHKGRWKVRLDAEKLAGDTRGHEISRAHHAGDPFGVDSFVYHSKRCIYCGIGAEHWIPEQRFGGLGERQPVILNNSHRRPSPERGATDARAVNAEKSTAGNLRPTTDHPSARWSAPHRLVGKALAVLSAGALLSSCAEFTADGHLKRQVGGVVAYEYWPGGHIKYVADFSQSFAAAATVVDDFLKALVAGFVTGDLAQIAATTQQMKNAGLTAAQIAQIKATAATQALQIKGAKPIITTADQTVTIPPAPALVH